MEEIVPNVVEGQVLYNSSCGYCKSNADTSVAYGLWSHSLSVQDYKDLLDLGWSRDGMFLYRPVAEKSCCKAYTIRLKVDLFYKSKEQIRVLRRMERYLDGTYNGHFSDGKADSKKNMVCKNATKSEKKSCEMSMSDKTCGIDCESKSRGEFMGTDGIARDLSFALKDAIRSCIFYGNFASDLEIPKITVQSARPSLRRRTKILNGEICYTSNIAFACAAVLMKHRNSHRSVFHTFQQSYKGPKVQDEGVQEIDPAVLAEHIALKLQNHDGLHNFKAEASKGHVNFISLGCNAFHSHHKTKSCASIPLNGELNSRNVCSVDANSIPTLRVGHFSDPGYGDAKIKHKLETRMRRSTFDPEEFALFQKYEIGVHHRKPHAVNESLYHRFLVDSPLEFVPYPKKGTSFCGFGSFHQQYLIDGRLVAVSVLDILPWCLLSVYLFWDPEFAFLSLGKYTALQEIQWVQEAKRHCPSMEYYYLGYYIHSCPKMCYKAAYRPSELLCPVRFQWVPFDTVCPLLDKQPYICLSDYLNANTSPKSTEDMISRKKKSSSFKDESELNNDTSNGSW